MQLSGQGLPGSGRLMAGSKGRIGFAGRAVDRDSVQAGWDLRKIQARLKGEAEAGACTDHRPQAGFCLNGRGLK